MRLRAVSLLFVIVLFWHLDILPIDAVTTPKIYVNPSEYSAHQGNIFTIELRVSDVESLVAWELYMTWNASVLSLVKVAEGPFLNSSGSYTSYFVMKKPGDSGFAYIDTVYVADTLLGAQLETSASGSGILATVTFRVVAQSSSRLDVHNTTMLRYDPFTPRPIDHAVEDGYFSALPSIPSVAFTYSRSPYQPSTGCAVILNASESHSYEDIIVSFAWSFGDQNTTVVSTPVITHVYSVKGIYGVNLTATNEHGETSSLIKDVIAGVSTVSISAAQTAIVFGEKTTISGSLFPVRQTVNLTIWCQPPGGPWKFLTNATTNIEGRFVSEIYAQKAGRNVIRINWQGDAYTYPAEASVIIDCLKVSTRMSISTSTSSALLGFRVEIAGMLQDKYGSGLGNRTVVIYYTFSGISSWVPLTSTVTDDEGVYFVVWLPSATGYFVLKTEWAGDVNHLGTSNTTTICSLAYKDKYVFSVESNSTISALEFKPDRSELIFKVTGQDGTRGYIRATVAKSLVASIEGVETKLNDKKVGYSAESADDSWLICFTYPHSTHNVTISLGSLTSRGATIGIEALTTTLLIGILAALIPAAAYVLKRKKKFSVHLKEQKP